MAIEVPDNFQRFLNLNSKNVNIVARIDGLEDILASDIVGTRIRYGDGTYYGETVDGVPLRYGGLRPWTSPAGGTVQPLLDVQNSSLTITQAVEQEQGRSSISTLALTFLDDDGYMTEVITPNVILPGDILGRYVEVFLGFKETSYPEDYWRVFAGRVQGVSAVGKRITLQLADPNLKRRREIFYIATTALASGITDSAGVIPVLSNSDFHNQILGPDGAVDPDVATYIQIDDEVIEYNRQAFGADQFTNVPSGAVVTRGARGTTAVAHDAGAPVSARIEIAGNPITLALKIMLSGWNGPYETGVVIRSIVFTGDPDLGSVPGAITLDPTVDAVLDLGLSIGDYITISGDANPSNNTTVIITGFDAVNDLPNRLIQTDDLSLISSFPTTAVAALRSQYDTLPLGCGMRMYPWEVDVESHVYARETFLSAEQMAFYFIETERNGKNFIEMQLYLPVGAYALTRYGTCAVKVTNPPISGTVLPELNWTDIVNPAGIKEERGISNRNFFNEITFEYNRNDQGNYDRTIKFIDADSIEQIGVISVLPITSSGTHSNLTSDSTITRRAQRFIDRYKRGAIMITAQVTLKGGVLIETGDIILLRDNGQLKIPDIETGQKNLGVQLLEVKQKNFNMAQMSMSLVLLGGLGFNILDRFATWGPSSQCSGVGSTTTNIRILPSYGRTYGLDEWRKWERYLGTRIRVHNATFTQDAETVLLALGGSNPNNLVVFPALPFTPDASHIVDLAPYSTSSSQNVDELAKLSHVFWSRSAPVVTGVSGTEFTVGSSDAQYFLEGYPLEVHKSDWSVNSPEVTIVTVVGTTITCGPLGFTPDSTYRCELLAFNDGRVAYRWI